MSTNELRNAVAEAFGIGIAARDDATILANINNALRRSACLSAIEQAFFTRETPPEDGDDQPGEECLLSWGAEPAEYVEQFRAALASAQPSAGGGAETPAAVGELRAAFNAWVRQQTGSLFSPGAQSSDFYFRIWLAGRSSAALASHRAAPVDTVPGPKVAAYTGGANSVGVCVYIDFGDGKEIPYVRESAAPVEAETPSREPRPSMMACDAAMLGGDWPDKSATPGRGGG